MVSEPEFGVNHKTPTMKKCGLLCFIAIILLSSCNQSFYNTRQHAHRNYIKIGPGIKNEHLPIAKAENETKKIGKENQQIPLTQTIPFKSTQKEKSTSSNLDNKVKSSKKTNSKAPVVQKRKYQKPHTKKTKATKGGGGVVNILSFIFSLIALIGFFVAAITLLFSLLEASFFAAGLAMLWSFFGLALLGITMGVLGLSLGLPSRGLGMAGIVMGGIVFFAASLILIIMAVI